MKIKTILFILISLFMLVGGVIKQKERKAVSSSQIVKKPSKKYLENDIKQKEQKNIRTKGEVSSVYKQSNDINFTPEILLTCPPRTIL
ncbi:MAG: hypothetical protein QM751_11425 [Paludibacteraceae bacterium]